MASFSAAELDSLDFRLLRHGATTLVREPALFDATVEQLAALGYRVHRIDAHARAPFLAGLTEALQFEHNFGYTPWTGNLDALNDAYRYLEFGDHRGVAFALRRFDALHAVEPRLARGALDLLESNARDHLLHGHRLLALVQSDDAGLDLDSLGGRGAAWRDSES